MLKIGISACFFHADPQRPIFKGMTLQYIEQNVAHWVMQRDAMALMIPSPDGDTRRAASRIAVADYARELDGLLLMGGSDVCPETYGEKAVKPEWNGDRIRDDYEIALTRAFMKEGKPVLGVCRGAQVINVARVQLGEGLPVAHEVHADEFPVCQAVKARVGQSRSLALPSIRACPYDTWYVCRTEAFDVSTGWRCGSAIRSHPN